MSNKVLLVRPENIYSYNNYPSLGLISIASVLQRSGYSVKIINCALEKDCLSTIKRNLKDCLFVGITLLTSECPNAYTVMKFIKENSNVPIVVGGWHSTLYAKQLEKCKFVDYIVVGGGEEHIEKIAAGFREGKPVHEKIFYRKYVDLEALPTPDYSQDTNIEKFINSYLTDKLSECTAKPMRWLPYETSRGCPGRCAFCANIVTNNRKYRRKSAEKVVFEIDHIVKKYHLTHVKIIDDNFFVDIERVRQICRLLIHKNLGVTWDAECRCDYFGNKMVDDETLILLKKSGLIQLTLGLESGSLHTLELIKKGITPEQAEFAVEKCNEHKIIVRASFIVGIPGETKEDIHKTNKFIGRLRRFPYFNCGVQTFRPYPKCELTQKLIEQKLLIEPKSFVEWTDEKNIELYVGAQSIRPWQIDAKYSEATAFYQTMESGSYLGGYLINKKLDYLKYLIFTFLAKIRNRTGFYRFSFDKEIYKRFFIKFYQRKQKAQKDIDQIKFICPVCNSARFYRKFDINSKLKHIPSGLTRSNKVLVIINQCADCGLEFSHEYAKEENYEALYTQQSLYSVKDYAYKNKLYPKYTVDIIDVINALRVKNKDALEIGFLSTELMSALKDLDWKVCGVDLDNSAVERATAQGFEAYSGKLDDPFFKNKKFDVIYSIGVLEHVSNPCRFLNEVFNLLNPKGFVLFQLPNPWSLNAYISKFSHHKWDMYSEPGHVFHYDRKNLITLLHRAGFLVCDYGTSTIRVRGKVPFLPFRVPRVEKLVNQLVHQYFVFEKLYTCLLKMIDRMNLGDTHYIIGQKSNKLVCKDRYLCQK